MKEKGEFAFIEDFSSKYFSKVPKGYTGIGDDCAVVPNFNGEEYTISTDMLVEDVHFISHEIGGYLLGHKSLAVNLSDIAASGATPCGAFLSLAIPDNMDIKFMDDFMKGFSKLSTVYGCPLIGGDTTRSRNGLVINVTVIGHCKEGKHKGRDKSQPGDIICVSGTLGDSAAGLEYILNPSLERTDDALQLIHRHHAPKPRIVLGETIGRLPQVHSMMDISDGVASDLRHILKRSGVSAAIELSSIPLSDLMKKVHGSSISKMRQLALCGGEDYELMFTVDKNWYTDSWAQSKGITAIGHITDAPGCQIIYTDNGEPTNGFGNGFDHFAC